MANNRSTWAEDAAINEQKPCKVPSCNKSRWKTSGYCMYHSQRHNVLGHPEALEIRPQDLDQYRAEMKELIELNETHDGVQLALSFIQDYLEGSARGLSSGPYGDLIAPLYDEGISPPKF